MDENGLTIERIFNAPKEMVWKAWTDPELIKQWWGPEHFTSPEAKVDLRVGGKYIFTMHGPEGSQWDKDMYTAGVFKEIIPNEKIVTTDYFSDENGELIEPSHEGQAADFPKELTVTILFTEIEEGKTKLTIHYPKPESEAAVKAMLASGMEQGWSTSLDKMAKVVDK